MNHIMLYKTTDGKYYLEMKKGQLTEVLPSVVEELLPEKDKEQFRIQKQNRREDKINQILK